VKPLAKAVTTSFNKKLGGASTTHAAQASCPSSCMFKDGGGCYAERGPLGWFVLLPLNEAADVAEATELDVAIAEAKAIDEMAVVVGRPMRLHTVGDCSSDEGARLVSAACGRYMDKGGGKVWTYTHAWRTVERSSWGRVSVLASCETDADVVAARRRGYVSALVVDEFEGKRRYRHGLTEILPCPSQTSHVTCSDCQLCFDDAALRERGYSIGFEIHGDHTTKKRARLSLHREEER
jgi:hypothetical protein